MPVNFPLFLISFAIYNMIVFVTPGVSWGDALVSVPMQSGATWDVTFGDALLGLSLVFLFVEMLKAARSIARAAFDHVLAALIFLGALAEFLLVPEAATSVFALLLLMTLIDLVAGWYVARRTARRDLTIESMPDNLV
jgi:hypothetical protein